MRKDKKQLVNEVYGLGIQIDMINGRLDHMTKDHIDDTWFEEDLKDIIDLAKQCIRKNYKDIILHMKGVSNEKGD